MRVVSILVRLPLNWVYAALSYTNIRFQISVSSLGEVFYYDETQNQLQRGPLCYSRLTATNPRHVTHFVKSEVC